MGWRIYRRMQVLPGVRVNLSKSGPSISVGPRGAVTTFSRRGKRTTLGVPGTGVSYSTYEPWPNRTPASRPCSQCGSVPTPGAKFCGKCGAQP